MAQLDPEYNKMLSTPASLNGPRKDTIDSLEERIDFYAGEARRLRYVRNSHVPISRLQVELLSEVFLYLVESGLQGGNTAFAPGTFSFLRVCKRWNEVGVGCPRLWSLWVAGAVEAWPLFKSRSKDAPLSLTWRPRLPDSARDILMDPAIPERTHRLDFSGTSDQLVHFLGIFDSNPPSNASSIRLQISRYDDREPREKNSRLLSSPFPKLSKLNIGNFLPSPSSLIFTTSSLTSLKLYLPSGENGRHSLAQFSQILQRHPTLRELNLNSGAIPLPGTSGTLVPLVLPQLTDLRLRGKVGDIIGFIDLTGMSSPLHDVVIHLDYVPRFTVPALASVMGKIVAAYYDSQGLDYPRKIDSLAISAPSSGLHLTLDARSWSAPASNFKLQFAWVHQLGYVSRVEETFCRLPAGNIQELTVEGLPLTRKMLEKMKRLSHLRICTQDPQDTGRAMDALSLGNQDEPHQQTAPKLEVLTLSGLELYGLEQKLLDVLKGRRKHNLGLKKLVVRSCRMHGIDDGSGFMELVNEVEWDNPTVADKVSGASDSADSDSDSDDSEESTDSEGTGGLDDVDVCDLSQDYID